MDYFSTALGLKQNESPFPWQEDLLARFIDGIVTRMLLDIPTGLGKTSVMAVWLVACTLGAVLPRRLIYVVDRRAVVDQATREAERLRCWLDSVPEVKLRLGLSADQSLPISTLRGQYVDTRQWLEDPAAPAIVVGTVDMIGSRLLFQGYGVSRKMRPYHAGMLGADTLFVLDEAHLVPPFEMMLETLALNRAEFGEEEGLAGIVPAFKLLSLSATGRSAQGDVLQLSSADLKHPVAKKRLKATKRLSFRDSDGSKPLHELLAEEAWELAECGNASARILVFSNSREDAEKAQGVLEKIAKGDKKQGVAPVEIATELFVGARRVHEREQAATWLAERGFLADSKAGLDCPTFVFATSAGEVGVDLDADHMVCDLVQWERMVQRLGRVNRRGNGNAKVRVVVEVPSSDKKPSEHRSERLRQPILSLSSQNGSYDASPGAIRNLKIKSDKDEALADILADATSPPPLRPALTRPVVDSWSMTSLEKHTGRPLVAPWLRGWVDEEPQTTVLWRRWLPVCENSRVPKKQRYAAATEFFEHAPPHLSELLETRSQYLSDWLTKRAKELRKTSDKEPPSSEVDETDAPLHAGSVLGVILTPALDMVREIACSDLDFERGDKKDNARRKAALQRDLDNNFLVVDLRFGGLSPSGLLDYRTSFQHARAGDDTDWAESEFRVRESEDGAGCDDPIWRTCFRFACRVSPDDEPGRWLLVERSRETGATEDSRSIAPQLQDLVTHEEWVETEVSHLAGRLRLPDDYIKMLGLVARLHDEGKRADRWQGAFSAPPGETKYAKTPGPVKPSLLDGYRHEFGSLPIMEADPECQRLASVPDLRDLALHLIAAHHGFARPIIGIKGCEDGPPSVLERRARDIALRFARLQHRWGPWGLAWWESLLRAADQRASRRIEQRRTANGKVVSHG